MTKEELKETNPYFNAIHWWEKKRWIYNNIVIGSILFSFLDLSEYIRRYGFGHSIWYSFILLFGANICYCMSWSFESMLIYYMKDTGMNKRSRIALLTSTCFFSFWFTVIYYTNFYYPIGFFI